MIDIESAVFAMCIYQTLRFETPRGTDIDHESEIEKFVGQK